MWLSTIQTPRISSATCILGVIRGLDDVTIKFLTLNPKPWTLSPALWIIEGVGEAKSLNPSELRESKQERPLL